MQMEKEMLMHHPYLCFTPRQINRYLYLMFFSLLLSVLVFFFLSPAVLALPPPHGQLHVSICH